MRLLLKIAILGAAITAAIWGVAEVLARSYLQRALSEGWPVASGRLEAIRDVFPRKTTTPSARQLEVEVRQMGIDLLPRTGRPKGTPPPPAQSAWKAIEGDTKNYVRERLSMAVRVPAPPSPPVVDFLRTNESQIQRIEENLISNPSPQWAVDLGKGFQAPIPNLLGHLSLARLLVTSALHHDSENRVEAAWRDLHAASSLPGGLFQRPDLISQLIALFEVTMITGAMRQLAGAPPQWASMWPEEDLLARMERAATADAWLSYAPFDTPPTADLFRAFAGSEQRSTFGGRVLSLIMSPYLRASAANTAMAHRQLLREYSHLPACSQAIPRKPREQLIPDWNVFGRVSLSSEAIGTSYQRAHQLLAHLDGTELMIAARSFRQSNGMWPSAAPQIRRRCFQLMWIYARTDSEGVLMTTTTPLFTLGTPGALNLPQRYVDH